MYQHHLDELLASGIDPQIIELNFESLEGDEAYEFLLYALEDDARRNDGRLRDKWLKKYSHLDNGAWGCRGLDPLNDWQPMEWGCLKPDSPREKDKGFGSTEKIKYEQPPKTSARAFFLDVPDHIGDLVAKNFNEVQSWEQVKAEGKRFWQWVLEEDIPFTLTEGAKKAGALLTAGYPAVGLPGIFNGYRTPKNEHGEKIGKPHLIPELELFATEGRKIYFAFDQDSNPKARRNTRKAVSQTGNLFRFNKCECFVISWDKQFKGVDDLIQGTNENHFHGAFGTAKSLLQFQTNYADLTYDRSLVLLSRFMGEFAIPTDALVAAIKAPKGSGKTYYIAHHIVAPVLREFGSDSPRILNISHRVKLGESLAYQLGIPYVTERGKDDEGDLFGMSLVIDSLHPNSQAKFNPEKWRGCILIIDEIEQFLLHLLNSSTCRKKRVEILECFKEVVRNASKIIIADADLSDVSLNYFCKLLGFNPKIFLVENQYKAEGYKALVYPGSNPKYLIEKLVENISNGEKAFVFTTGQKHKSSWGTRTLERYLRRLFPDLKILRIDSEALTTKDHPAFGCMNDIDKVLSEYDVVIASPSIETGISIDIKGHFDGVYGIAWGVLPENSIRQALMRVRETIPRYLWIQDKGIGTAYLGNGALDCKGVLASIHQNAKGNQAILAAQKTIGELMMATDIDSVDFEFQSESLTTWGILAARVNQGLADFKKIILENLAEEGHEIIEISEDDLDADSAKSVQTEVRATKEINYSEYRERVSSRDDYENEEEYQEAKQKISREDEKERERVKKADISRRYLIPVTPKLIEKDDNNFYGEIRLHYYFDKGRQFLSEREWRLAKSEFSSGAIFKPDFVSSHIGVKIKVLEMLQFSYILNNQNGFRGDDPKLAEIAEFARNNSWQIKQALGIFINKDEKKMSNIAIAQALARKVGYSIPRIGRVKENGKQVYLYDRPMPDFLRDEKNKPALENGRAVAVEDERESIFEAWIKRDLEARNQDKEAYEENQRNLEVQRQMLEQEFEQCEGETLTKEEVQQQFQGESLVMVEASHDDFESLPLDQYKKGDEVWYLDPSLKGEWRQVVVTGRNWEGVLVDWLEGEIPHCDVVTDLSELLVPKRKLART
jgi:hypothetical protein